MAFTVELSGSELNLLICALDKEQVARQGQSYRVSGREKEHARGRAVQARELQAQLAMINAQNEDEIWLARMEGRVQQMLENSRERRARDQRMVERQLRKILTPPVEEAA